MCTLTYLPTGPQGRPTGAWFTSNRDEFFLRSSALPPAQHTHGATAVLHPTDPDAGGTWFGASRQWALCLLNGAFERHSRTPPYRRSRGQVLLDFYSQHQQDWASYCGQDFGGIEPFMLVALPLGPDGLPTAVHELRWDGQAPHTRRLTPHAPHIWSSAQLYDPEVIALREQWWAQWLRQHTHSPPQWDDIIGFHHFGGLSPTDPHTEAIALRMNRAGIVRTVSITSLAIGADAPAQLYYHDVLSDQVHHSQLAPTSTGPTIAESKA